MSKRDLFRPSLSSQQLIVAVAVFVAALSNVAFFKAAFGAYNFSGLEGVFLASLFVYITALFILLLSVLCHRKTVKPILIGFLLLSSVISFYSLQYGTIFDHRMIENIFETNRSEAGDLLHGRLLLHVLALGVIPSLAILYVRYERPHWKVETVARLKLMGAAGLTLAALTFGLSSHYTSMRHEHLDVRGHINPTFALSSTAKVIKRRWLSPSYAHIAVGTDARRLAGDGHRELIVMVVGETARADHFSLNGYARKTNPLLENEDVISFTNFWSCETSTAKSVPCMFSHLGRAGFSRERARASDNALDILKRAGVTILWRDNNSDSKGVADRVVYEDFQRPETNPSCEGGECRDEGMLAGLQDFIDAQTGDVLIVLHQMGNHGPAYYKRYPAAFETFKPACKSNDLGSCSAEEIHNAYDNALLYTDYFLAKVIELLKKNDGNFETALLYVSDHGESLGEYGFYLHATPYAVAPEAQKHIPAILWLGQSIRHDVRLDGIDQRRRRTFSHDSVFLTLLGLFEVESQAYKPEMDLLEHADLYGQ